MPHGRVGMEAEIELFPFSRPVRKGGVIDFYLAGAKIANPWPRPGLQCLGSTGSASEVLQSLHAGIQITSLQGRRQFLNFYPVKCLYLFYLTGASTQNLKSPIQNLKSFPSHYVNQTFYLYSSMSGHQVKMCISMYNNRF